MFRSVYKRIKIRLTSVYLSHHTASQILQDFSSVILRFGKGVRRGLFREAADVSSVKRSCSLLDTCLPSEVLPLLEGIAAEDSGEGVLVVCDLMKLLLRRMAQPLVPSSFYERCVEAGQNGDSATVQVNRAADFLYGSPPAEHVLFHRR